MMIAYTSVPEYISVIYWNIGLEAIRGCCTNTVVEVRMQASKISFV
jgi:hypothetical protein